jgi:nitrite reductase/ring-hydroxylating ferredoxin subunit
VDDAGPIEALGDVTEPVVIPIDAYASREYAEAEGERLWSKVWQSACRLEEVPNVGDYVTYDIGDESIIVVRTAPDRIRAFYNVCQHRGRRLTSGCGHTRQFFCRFHGWRWNIDGENIHITNEEDWGGCLTPENTALAEIKLDTWGGWVWINMDPNCEPLQHYLKPAAELLDPYRLDKMRYRWRQWLYFPCNWKTALEAFNESYHARISHPHLNAWGETTYYWCRAEGKHAWHGPGRGSMPGRAGAAPISAQTNSGPNLDARVSTAEFLHALMNTVNSCTTDTLVNAADRLVDELPPDASAGEVLAHLTARAMADDAARGVDWPMIDPSHMERAGHDWHLFPNLVVLQGLTYALCYRSRPNGPDPNGCIFEVYVLERYPEGQEPKTEWEYVPDPFDERWPLVLQQDFQNMPEVQRGMKSRGFKGARTNPHQEVAVTHFHETLAKYMGVGAPRPLRPA